MSEFQGGSSLGGGRAAFDAHIILLPRFVLQGQTAYGVDLANIHPHSIPRLGIASLQLDPHCLPLLHGQEHTSTLCDRLWQTVTKGADIVERKYAERRGQVVKAIIIGHADCAVELYMQVFVDFKFQKPARGSWRAQTGLHQPAPMIFKVGEVDKRVIDIDDPGCEVGLGRTMDSNLPCFLDKGICTEFAKGVVCRSDEGPRFFEA